MIPIVRTFGAPVIDPLGKSARKTSGTPAPGSSSAVTVDVSCQTVSKRSGSNTLAHRTVPGRAMRPRSLRRRSTIIAFSARSFADAVEPLALGVVLRGPATSRRGALHRSRGQPVAVQPEEQLRRRGHDAVAARVQVRAVGAALRVAEVAVETPLVAFDDRAQPERVVHLIRVARGDVLADLRDRQVVAGAVDGRHPRVGRRGPVAR